MFFKKVLRFVFWVAASIATGLFIGRTLHSFGLLR